jgi:hypothetical protein
MPAFNSSLQVDTMKTMTLKGYFAALLLSLISFANAGFGSPLPTTSGAAWEAAENGTDYKIIKVSDERFLIVY